MSSKFEFIENYIYCGGKYGGQFRSVETQKTFRKGSNYNGTKDPFLADCKDVFFCIATGKERS